MPTIWMVSAHFGEYTNTWVEGGYVAVGWLPDEDLTSVVSRDEIFDRYRKAHPDETPHEVGAKAGQLATFVLKVQPGDYVMTRCAPPTREYRYGELEEAPLFYAPGHPDGCSFPHRRRVRWSEQPIAKAGFSIPAQKNLSAARTLFEFRHMEEFRLVTGDPSTSGEARKSLPTDLGGDSSRTGKKASSPRARLYKEVLDQILRIDPTEFEYLILALMEAMGFEGVERTGGAGDGGVDVKGTLQSSLVNIDVYVQAKHYGGNRVRESDVRSLRGAIPTGGQGAIITTSTFHKKAVDAARDQGFARVTLIDGKQLVELLIEHWNADSLAHSPDEDVLSWHERLGLTQGLVPR